MGAPPTVLPVGAVPKVHEIPDPAETPPCIVRRVTP
jgi:hypothetical protein